MFAIEQLWEGDAMAVMDTKLESKMVGGGCRQLHDAHTPSTVTHHKDGSVVVLVIVPGQ